MTAPQVREHADLGTDRLRRAARDGGPRARRPPRPARRASRRPVRLGTARRRHVDPRLPVRRHPHPRPLAAPRGHLPGHQPGPAPDRRARRPHRGQRRGRLGPTTRSAIRRRRVRPRRRARVRGGAGSRPRADRTAGATFTAGTDGPHLQMDAIEFCRTLSGREEGTGILATPITF
jgi:hypothetical protein